MKTVIALALLACSASATAATWVCQGQDVSNPEKPIPMLGAYIVHDFENHFVVSDDSGMDLFESGKLTDTHHSKKISGFKGGILYSRGVGNYKGSFSMFWMQKPNNQVKGIFFNCKESKDI